MRDLIFKLAPEQEQLFSGRFDFLRIVRAGDPLNLQFPNGERSLFEQGDILHFGQPLDGFRAHNPGPDPLDIWIKTAAGDRMQSALLTGTVIIDGVEQDASDPPLIVRVGRGAVMADAQRVTWTAGGSPPPGSGPWMVGWQVHGTSGYPATTGHFHITNNHNVPAGSLQRFIDGRVCLMVSAGGVLTPWRWIEPDETVVVPAPDNGALIFGQLSWPADYTNSAASEMLVIPELQ